MAGAEPADELLLDALLEEGAMELLDFEGLEMEAGLTAPPVVPQKRVKAEANEDEVSSEALAGAGGLVKTEVAEGAGPLPDLTGVEETKAGGVDDKAEAGGRGKRGDQTAESKESKKQRRLIRNRMSAQLHRERKKAYVDHLEAEVKSRDDEIAALKEEVARLKQENASLRACGAAAAASTSSASANVTVSPSESGYSSPSSLDGKVGAQSPSRDFALDDDSSIASAQKDDAKDDAGDPAATSRKRPRASPAATLALATLSCVLVFTTQSKRPGPSRAAFAARSSNMALDRYDADAYADERAVYGQDQDQRRTARKLLALPDASYEDAAAESDAAHRRAASLVPRAPLPDSKIVDLFVTSTYNASRAEPWERKQAPPAGQAPRVTLKNDQNNNANGLRGRGGYSRRDGDDDDDDDDDDHHQDEDMDEDVNATRASSASYVMCTDAAGVLGRAYPTNHARTTAADGSETALVAKPRNAPNNNVSPHRYQPNTLDDNLFMQLIVPASDLDFSAWADVPHVDPPKWVEIGCNLAYARTYT